MTTETAPQLVLTRIVDGELLDGIMSITSGPSLK